MRSFHFYTFTLLHSFTFAFAAVAANASALEYDWRGVGLKLTGEGMLGGTDARNPESYVISDFKLRGQANYVVSNGWTLGAIYSIDQISAEHHYLARDAFVFTEGPKGRLELGWTESIAAKLGLGLPDVGALRLNDYSIAYNIANPDVPIISNPAISSTRYAFRVNAATIPTRPWQFGVSVAPWSEHFKNATDIGVKYRKSGGKTKIAMTFGASYIDSPEDLRADFFSPRVTADFRAEMTAGLNIQYNSWIWGLNAKGIYDQNPILPPSDGLRLGTGLSYDFLKYSASVSYIFSDTGIWHDIAESRIAHTGVVSLRYKIDEYFDIWASGGLTASDIVTSPFIAAGIHGKF
ncbi:MAG: porin [Rickettsiales bacterium]|nr:porin [Rickettsiales bacterium]